MMRRVISKVYSTMPHCQATLRLQPGHTLVFQDEPKTRRPIIRRPRVMTAVKVEVAGF